MLLELDRLSVSYGSVNALVDVPVSIDSKAVVRLGPAGAGQSGRDRGRQGGALTR